MNLRYLKVVLLAMSVSILTAGSYMFFIDETLNRRIDGLNKESASLDQFEKTLNEQKAKGVGISGNSFEEISSRRQAIEDQKSAVSDDFMIWSIGIGGLTFLVICGLGVLANRRRAERKMSLADLSKYEKS